MKKIHSLLLAFAAILLTACEPAITNITLNKSSLELEVGEQATLTASVQPSGVKDVVVKWSSSSSCVTVSNGIVTAVSAGTATITASAGEVNATCQVTVKPKSVKGITLDKTAVALEVGETVTLTASIDPPDAEVQKLEWTSSDKCVTVKDGLVTAVEKGTATVTVSAGSFSASCAVTVTGKSTKGITLDVTEATLEIGESVTIKATIDPPDAEDGKVEWASSNACVTVKDGVVTAVEKGTATVTASIGEISAACTVTVIGKTVKSVTLDKTTLTIEKGQQAKLTAKVLPEDAEYDGIEWESSDIYCVSVEDGEVTGEDLGTATITASVGDFSATCEVTVVEPAFVAKERAALVAFYNSNNGANWKNDENWLSDKPVSSWYGVTVDDSGHVIELQMVYNNVYGRIPKEIADLTQLNSFSIVNSYPPTSECYPLPAEMGQLKEMTWMSIADYSIGGTLPESLFSLDKLTTLTIYGTSQMQAAPMPKAVKNLKSLNNLTLSNLNFTGPLISELGELTGLTYIDLRDNNLTGSIPPELGSLINLTTLRLGGNSLSGTIPPSICSMKDFWKMWPDIVFANKFEAETLYKSFLPAPQSPPVKAVDGSIIDMEEEFGKNTYTVLYKCDPAFGISGDFMPQLVALYNANKDKGLGIISYTDINTPNESEIKKHRQKFLDLHSKNGATWKYFYREMYADIPVESSPFYTKQGYSLYPANQQENAVIVIGPDKTVAYATVLDYTDYRLDRVIEFLEKAFNTPITHYESTSYAADGKVTALQTASVGNGVDLVITGDAFSDRQISNGTFEKAAKQAVADLFSVEPLKSLKNRFNIYLVNAVSKNEEYFNGNSTVFGGVFGGGSAVGGIDAEVYEYAKKAVGDGVRMDNVTVLVLMNSQRDGGTTYMDNPEDASIFAGGPSVAWITYKDVSVSSGVSNLAGTVIHEVGGHAIAKLADEYAYRDAGKISASSVDYVKAKQKLGWYQNVDFTSDPKATFWSKFVGDSNFASEKIGAYEGGFTFWSGVWRPTEQSVMNDSNHHTEFNAPSRAQIYTRVMKLSEGSSWNFDYDAFVTWDKAHPTKASATRSSVGKAKEDEHIHIAPVATGKTWRETINKR
ncbi:MAG: Ig-like domain-containing protein [Bacteroidales bacterium]|nr:Ig-like domain-containing protein [Bacteroidales bacterium]